MSEEKIVLLSHTAENDSNSLSNKEEDVEEGKEEEEAQEAWKVRNRWTRDLISRRGDEMKADGMKEDARRRDWGRGITED